MILVDANVFMYAAGRAHANKAPSFAFLERVAKGHEDAAVDAEILQEILHRYRAIGRWEDGREVYDLVRAIVPIVIPIDDILTDRARGILNRTPGIMARDALHAAVIIEKGLDGIATFDRDFDRIRGVKRIEPR